MLFRSALLPPPMSQILGHSLYLSPAVPYFLLQCLRSRAFVSISHEMRPTSSSNVSDPGPSSLCLTRCALLPTPMSPILGHPLYLSPNAPYFLLQCLQSWAILSIFPQLHPASFISAMRLHVQEYFGLPLLTSSPVDSMLGLVV